MSISRFPLIVGGVSGIGFGLYVFGYIFLSGSTPGKNKNQDKFIDDVCAPTGLLKTVLTWGYFKATVRRFIHDSYALIYRVPTAKLGGPALDAKLIALDGSSRRLFADYIHKQPAGVPLILNMGSFT